MSLPREMRREIYRHMARTSPRGVYRAATVNREAKSVQAHLNVLKRALRRRALAKRRPSLRRRLQLSPNYRIPLWNARNEATARARLRATPRSRI